MFCPFKGKLEGDQSNRNKHILKSRCLSHPHTHTHKHTVLAQMKPGFPVCPQFSPKKTNGVKPEIQCADRLALAHIMQQED